MLRKLCVKCKADNVQQGVAKGCVCEESGGRKCVCVCVLLSLCMHKTFALSEILMSTAQKPPGNFYYFGFALFTISLVSFLLSTHFQCVFVGVWLCVRECVCVCVALFEFSVCFKPRGKTHQSAIFISVLASISSCCHRNKPTPPPSPPALPRP